MTSSAPIHPATAGRAPPSAPLVIERQGSFAVGGTVATCPTAPGLRERTIHGDHAYVSYQIPADARPYPIVFLHGNGQSAKTWETTPDGREGFQTLFLRRSYPVYVVDQPRRGRAGRSAAAGTLTPDYDDQTWFDTFRVGIWPDYFAGVQFSRDPAALDQYLRQMTPNTAPFDLDVTSNAISALFGQIGPAILVSHSRGGGVGWFAAIKSAGVRAIISYEPGSNFPFPQGEVPPPMPSAGGALDAAGVPLADFLRLTKLPILIVYGDFIPAKRVDNPGQDLWRVRLDMARLWADAVNRHGGDATIVHLPEIGLTGNTHFPFSDLNNIEIAEHMSGFLARHGLDRP